MKIPAIGANHLLTVTDLSADEIRALFDFARYLKSELRAGRETNFLPRKTLAMIFEKQSTRTRVSFEIGMYQLGGQALFLGSDDIQIGRGETIPDTAKVLSRYADGIMIRTFSHRIVEELAANASIPVINGLTDSFHPCQALADYLTIGEITSDFSSVKLAYIGDGNNMAHSLMLNAAILGSSIAVATPPAYRPEKAVTDKAMAIALKTGAKIDLLESVEEAAKDADFLYTDVWTSMGQEKESAQRKKDFDGYKITKKILDLAASDCKVMHCLPAHRGEEIDADVIDSSSSIIFDQAENRLHIQKSIMCALMGKQ